MRLSVRLVVLLLAWIPTLAYAGAPPVHPLSEIPGMKPEVGRKMIADAIGLAQKVFNNYGDRVGYPTGSKIEDVDVQCMVYLGILSGVNHGLANAQPNSAIANGLNKAAKWAQKGIDEWCRPRGGQPNRGLVMLEMAAQDVNKGNANKAPLEEGWADKFRNLDAKLSRGESLTPGETAAVAAIVFFLAAKELVPVIP